MFSKIKTAVGLQPKIAYLEKEGEMNERASAVILRQYKHAPFARTFIPFRLTDEAKQLCNRQFGFINLDYDDADSASINDNQRIFLQSLQQALKKECLSHWQQGYICGTHLLYESHAGNVFLFHMRKKDGCNDYMGAYNTDHEVFGQGFYDASGDVYELDRLGVIKAMENDAPYPILKKTKTTYIHYASLAALTANKQKCAAEQQQCPATRAESPKRPKFWGYERTPAELAASNQEPAMMSGPGLAVKWN